MENVSQVPSMAFFHIPPYEYKEAYKLYEGVLNEVYPVSAPNLTNELNDSTMTSVNAIAENLNSITTKMNSKDSSLGLLLNDNRLYNNADQTILSLDSLFKDIKANPKRYINVKVF